MEDRALHLEPPAVGAIVVDREAVWPGRSSRLRLIGPAELLHKIALD